MDHRVKQMEYAVAQRNLDVSNVELLPDLVASAGYTSRNNDAGARSQSLLSGEESLEPSTSQERDRDLRDLTIAWNVLDFGVSYVTSKQKADEILIAEERRRKVVQNIVQDVQDAFWRAYSAQTQMENMNQLLVDTNNAIARVKRLSESGNYSPQEALEYQQELLQTQRNLTELKRNMVLAKTRLGTLMNLRPGTDFTLVADGVRDPMPLNTSLDELETMALVNRPELREEDYKKRISQNDVKKAVLRMFPGLEFRAGAHYDSNKFLYNNDWTDAGINLTWNILNVFGGIQARKMAKTQVELADIRRMALSMAVMTQVHLATRRYELALEQYRTDKDLADVSGSLESLSQSRSKAKMQNELKSIKTRASAMIARMRADYAHAEARNALARVYNTIGMDPLPEKVEGRDIKTLASAINQHWNGLLLQK
ncbi:MAG: transporter [Gammaproteobacteria bacterium]|nr:MAG: transporter [Gammaproteobacteria bacterium]